MSQPLQRPLERPLRGLVTAAAHLLRFIRRVIVAFLGNHGLLLASGVGYNLLLSLIPLLAVMVVGLSLVLDQQQLMATIARELEILVPGHADEISRTVQGVFDSRDVFGVIGFAALLFFSSMAFRMLEEAFFVIFHRPPRRRGFWASFLLPYAYVGVLGAGLVVLVLVRALLDALDGSTIHVLGWEISLASMSNLGVYAMTLMGQVLLITSLYKILPHVHVSWRNAMSGALAATLLWELVSRVLVYYFAHLSLVNVVYGSLATVVVVLLTLEFGATIVLLGAQVMAELERSRAAGLPWYQAPELPPKA